MKKNSGVVVIILLVVVTVGLWLMGKTDWSVILDDPFRSLSQLSALLAALLFSVTIFLATRARFLEDWFGGMDRVYGVHHVVSGMAYALACYHLIWLLVSALPNVDVAINYITPGANLAWTLGSISLFVFTVLIFLTVFIKLPYHLWKLTHIFMGIPFVVAIVHALLIPSDISRYLPLRYWLLSLMFIALVAVIYRRFFYSQLAPSYNYIIKEVIQKGLIWEIVMVPEQNRFDFYPGQFLFVQFDNDQLGKEKHPFSIASSPNNPDLHLAIKESGDYTAKLKYLQVGEQVKLLGPYGRFYERFFTEKKTQIWVAGGIGITPFLSFLEYEVNNPTVESIWFFYSVKIREEAVYAEEIINLVNKNARINFIIWVADELGYITADKILEQIGNPSKIPPVLICGPMPMSRGLQTQFLQKGLAEKDFIFEDFSIK